MVLYLNHCHTSSNMYPASNRHPSQNFSIAPYGYGQQAGQYGASDMGCAVAAQYQMAAVGLGNLGEGMQQGSPSAMSWHTPAVYMSSCSRGAVTFDPAEWSQGQQGVSPCNHVGPPPPPPPSSHQGLALAPSPCGFAGNYKLTNGQSSAAEAEEYSAQVQVQDLTHGHHSPDSGLTVSSDGVSSSDSPQHPNHHGHHTHHNHHAQTMNRPTPVRSPFEWMKTKSAFPAPQNSGHPRSSSKGLDVLLTEGGKTRTKDKYRVVYSDNQRLELEKEFHFSRYITIRRKSELAQSLGLSERQVKIWFQNRRAKERKQGKKRDELKIKDPGMMGPSSLQIPPGHGGAVCLKKLEGIPQRDMEQYDSSVRPRPLGLGDMGPSYNNNTTTFL